MRWLRNSLGVLVAALWIVPLAAQEPTGTIHGHVTDDATQRPLQGVSLTVGSRTTTSRPDGSYVLSGVPAGTDTLKVRMIGYAMVFRPVSVVGGETLIVDVVMNAQAVNLSEMVVIGYGELAAGNITGAVTNVTPEEFNTGRVITPSELIQSKVAGVQVVESNEPGGGTTIRVRGPTSTSASNEPASV